MLANGPKLTLYACTRSTPLCSKRPEIPLHFFFSINVCLIISVDDTLFLEMFESFDHVVLTVPMRDAIL